MTSLRFHTAETLYGPQLRRGLRPSEMGPTLGQVRPLTEDEDPEITTPAIVNHGRWIVECPFPNCGGAQAASRTDPRFLCITCGNVGASNRWVRVVWPDHPEAIEDVLAPRPPMNRNWRPGETLEQLELENVGHGIGDR